MMDMNRKLLKTIKGNDEPISLKRIVREYNISNNETKEIINDIFISLTGYQLTTLVDSYANGLEL